MGICRLKKLEKAIFLDRDGVLNHAIIKDGKPYPPTSVDEISIPEGVQTSLNTLKSVGFLLIGATNQPDVARGASTRSQVEAINGLLVKELCLNEIRVCYHDDKDDCICRKPRPGLLNSAATDHGIDLAASYMIGDRWRDIDAGRNAGCKTIWLRTDYVERKPSRMNYIANNFAEATQWILRQILLMN